MSWKLMCKLNYETEIMDDEHQTALVDFQHPRRRATAGCSPFEQIEQAA
ncbi:MAG: hypothetical protein M1608_00655 [Candidatus Omnitrophica bacterium]|nr:hypothetical protein [Candidatus Omnitrophota bacterium]